MHTKRSIYLLIMLDTLLLRHSVQLPFPRPFPSVCFKKCTSAYYRPKL